MQRPQQNQPHSEPNGFASFHSPLRHLILIASMGIFAAAFDFEWGLGGEKWIWWLPMDTVMALWFAGFLFLMNPLKTSKLVSITVRAADLSDRLPGEDHLNRILDRNDLKKAAMALLRVPDVAWRVGMGLVMVNALFPLAAVFSFHARLYGTVLIVVALWLYSVMIARNWYRTVFLLHSELERLITCIVDQRTDQ